MKALRVCCLLVPAVTAPSVADAVQRIPNDGSAARIALDRAVAFLQRGQADSALNGYRQALAWALAGPADSQMLGEVYFGIATAKGAIADSAAGNSRVSDYLMAVALDSAHYFVAATNNAAQVLRRRGDHSASARLFALAADETHPARPYILLDAGHEWQQAGRPDSALASFERAAREDPDNQAAVEAFATLALRQRAYRRLLDLPNATADAAAPTQEIVADALLDLMGAPDVGRGVVDSALTLLAHVLIRVGGGPPHFALTVKPRLADVAERSRHAGASSLIEAYAKPPTDTHPPPWWQDDASRRGTWTRTMTALGAWHERRGDPQAARLYYERALGFPQTFVAEPWIDHEALLPLGRLYAELDQSSFDQFVRWVFEEKGLMYEQLRFDAPRAVPLLRRLHLTLGLMFARRLEWGSSENDIRGAAFQLGRMREFTQRMHADGVAVSDPPEALEQLVYAYWSVGMRIEAMALVPAVVAGYEERNRAGDAERVSRITADETLLARVVAGEREP